MFFRMPRFIRRYIRRKMHPMSESTAEQKRQRLAILYAIIAWHAGGLVLYQMSTGNVYWPVTHGLVSKEENQEAIKRPALDIARRMGIKNAEVYRVGGFGGVKNNYVINNDNNPEVSSDPVEEAK